MHLDCAPEQARAWFAGLLDHITTAEPWKDGKPPTTLNVAVTATGLKALGVSKEVVDTFSSEFRDGMAKRAKKLGDAGPSDPGGWEQGLGTGDAHVLLTINAQKKEDHVRALGKMKAAMQDAGGIRVVYQENTALLKGAREHFGYADGFAQPAIEGFSDAKARGGGVLEKDGRWRALAAGEFVLGYPTRTRATTPSNGCPPHPPTRSARAARTWCGASSTRTSRCGGACWPTPQSSTPAARAQARGEGRRALGGRHAARHAPRWADPDFDPSKRGANDFRFNEDLDGRRCPIGAHIRRSNPRDALGFETALTFRHRMIRRGMPYGDPLPSGVKSDDGTDRGLVFVTFQASISRQFEAVQIQWLNDGNIFGLGHDADFLLGAVAGAEGGKMTIQGDPPFFLAPQETFVKTRGGEYLYVPGMSALAAIADGTTG